MICTHPDHNETRTCRDRAVGCNPECACCMSEPPSKVLVYGGESATTRFARMVEKLREDGKLFPCTVCGHERDTAGCLECEEREFDSAVAILKRHNVW